MHTTDKGDITVAVLAARMLQSRAAVLKPLTENSRYDLVIDRGHGFERVQCKTGRIRKGVVAFRTASTHHHRGGGLRGYIGEADLFGVYCPDNDECYLIPVSDLSVGIGYLRITPPKNKQVANVKYAAACRLDKPL